MEKAAYFLLGFTISSFVSCAVAYLVGSSVIAEFAKIHQGVTDTFDRAVQTFSKMHLDAVAALLHVEDKAKAVAKDLTA